MTGQYNRRALEHRVDTAPPPQDMSSTPVVTASLGVSTGDHAAGQETTGCRCTLADLIRRADRSLYAAKAAGHNRA